MDLSSILIVSDRRETKEALQTYLFHPHLRQFRDAKKQQEAITQALIHKEITDISLLVDNQTIVGYATLVPPESFERWIEIPYSLMLGALEIIPSFRGKGLGKQMIKCLFDKEEIEEKIIISLNYYWHWDLKRSKLSVYEYKRMLKHVLSSVGMEVLYTDDPDINAHAANFMMARIGKNISSSQLQEFLFLTNPRVF